jgi:16S rRNA processing protein RimM
MEGKSRDTRIEHFRHQHGRWVVKLESIDSISDAEEWIGASLSVRKSELPDADEGSYFSFDLEGCDVYTDLRRVGAVKRILDYGSTVLLEVDRDGREVLIPFAEAYLEKVDIERKRIDVRLPDGLLELNG